MSEPHSTYDLARLEQLIADKCNGALSADDLQELEQILLSSADARRIYCQSISVHAALEWELAGKPRREDDISQLVLDGVENALMRAPSVASHSPSKRFVWLLPLAGCLVVASSAFLFSIRKTDERLPSQAIDDTSRKPMIIGELTPLVPDTSWTFGTSGGRNRRDVAPGETVWLNRGAAELRLTNGTVATLEAPVILQMESLDRARVLRGRISVRVAKGAEGFTVVTESADVIDLGTTFSVDVNEARATDVIVFEGKVDLKLPSQVAASDQSPTPTLKHLQMGEAIRVHNDGTTSRIVQVRQTDFRALPQRPPLISAVRDNLARDSGTLQFYEIVPGGMDEDARAFVDRDHEWNGTDARGLPEYLKGGDYVKTCNGDKVTAQLLITLSVERPCIVYALIDKRVPPPQWVLDSFTPTGDEVGVDESSDDPTDDARGSKHVADRGPGKSIDEFFAVWARRISHSGEVTLGRNAPVLGEIVNIGETTGVSMYGIVVTPLSKSTAN